MSTTLKVKAQSGDCKSDVPLGASGLRYVGFAAHQLATGQALRVDSGELELCLVVLCGRVDVTVDGAGGAHAWRGIGERESVFDPQSPYAVYVPEGATLTVTGASPAQVAIASAPGPTRSGQPERAAALPPRLILPAQMTRSVRGSGSNTRHVCDILPETEAAASLLVVEVITPPGNSSSYPPHKHDSDNLPHESFLEEIYYHRLNPPQGFAFQRVYTDSRDIDESLCVEDHDVVKVPRGYHPVVVPHGYTSYYLNVMAGPRRVWKFHNDPAHEWLFPR